MTLQRVCVIDYGTGNIFSVVKSLELQGGSVIVSSDPVQIKKSDRVVLPGVGAFENGIRALRRLGLNDAVMEFCNKERPILGICLGMQLLATFSEEFGITSGLNLIPGKVIKLDPNPKHGLKVPQIGWVKLSMPEGQSWRGGLLDDIRLNEEVYVVHSYHYIPEKPQYILAHTNYNGVRICVMVKKHNITGCQFHPEKSGRIGLKILKNFLNY